MSTVLVINSGSSSVKFELVEVSTGRSVAHGLVEQIGEESGHVALTFGAEKSERTDPVPDHGVGLRIAFELMADAGVDLHGGDLLAVGHRVVHGGTVFSEPVLIDDGVVAAIDQLSSLAPLHNPPNLLGIEVARKELPSVPQVAVFDTAFFHVLPNAAATYAIDTATALRYGIRKYGFHGTSHEYVSGAVATFLDRDPASLNQIVLHLGNGASASSIRGGAPTDTTMGLTPLEGLVMGTRSGDIDAGVLLHLSRNAQLSVDDIDDLLNRRSGIKGLSGVNDFRELRTRIDAGDPNAQLAYDVYIHRLRRYIGAYLIDLGRVDTITFTAGVGENDENVRADSLASLQNYGISVDPERNAVRSKQPRVISPDGSPITVLVVPTDEELAIARAAAVLVRR